MTTDRVAGGGLALLAVVVLWESRKLPLGSLTNPGPAYVPVVLGILVLIFGGLILAFGAGAPRLAEVGWSEWRHAVAIFAVCAFAALAMERIGFRATVALSLAFLVGAVERKRPLFTLVFSLAFALGTFYLFDTLLRVPLPHGPFGI